MSTTIEVVTIPVIKDNGTNFKYELRITQGGNKVKIPLKMCSTPEDVIYKLAEYLDFKNIDIETSIATDKIQYVPVDKIPWIDPLKNPHITYTDNKTIVSSNISDKTKSTMNFVDEIVKSCS